MPAKKGNESVEGWVLERKGGRGCHKHATRVKVLLVAWAN